MNPSHKPNHPDTPLSGLSAEDLVRGVTERERGMLERIKELKDLNDGNRLMEIMQSYDPGDQAAFLGLVIEVKRLGSYFEIRERLIDALEAFKDGTKPSWMTKKAPVAPVITAESSRSMFRKTLGNGDATAQAVAKKAIRDSHSNTSSK